MNKIVLINPPSPRNFQANRDFMGGFGATNAKGITRVPPTMVEYVAGTIAAAGLAVETIDAAVVNDRESIYPSLSGALMVGAYCGTATFDDDIAFIHGIKERAGAFTFMFGPQVSVTPEYALQRSNLDAVVIGEPEHTVRELVQAVMGKTNPVLSAIPGLLWRSGGSPVRNIPREFEMNLDSFALPYRNAKQYGEYYYKENETPFISVVSSRGCPYHCMYCPYPVAQGTKFRARSPEHVLAELEAAKKEIDFKMILFRDPVFTFDRERTIRLARLVHERFPDVVWRCETTTRNVDAELLRIMKESGCAGINFGIETGSAALIGKYAQKTGGLEHIAEIFDTCRKLGLYTIGFFIVGLPGETKETLRETAGFARRLDPVDVNFTAAAPFPGTELHQHLRSRGVIRGDEFESFKTSTCISSTENLTAEELQREIIAIYSRFYMRPGRLLFEFRRQPWVFVKKCFLMFSLLQKHEKTN